MKKNLSQSIEDYLETIYLIEKKDGKVHSVKIAEELNVSKPAVTKATDELSALHYINKEAYGDIVLTLEGRKIAKSFYHRHTMIKKFLISIGVSEESAEID